MSTRQLHRRYLGSRGRLRIVHCPIIALLVLGALMTYAQGVAANRTGDYVVADAGGDRPSERAITILKESVGDAEVPAASTDMWNPASFGLTDADITALEVDPTDSDTLYAGTGSHGVFKSTNAGVDWAPTGLGDVRVNVIVIDPSHPGTVYVGTGGQGLLKTSDGGHSWKSAGPDIADVSLVTIGQHYPGSMVAGYRGGNSAAVLYRITDGGQSWTQIGLPSKWPLFVTTDPNNPDVIYLLDYGLGGMDDVGFLRKSIDGGKTWESHSLHDNGMYNLVVDPTNSNTLYGYDAYAPGLVSWKSTDGAKTWEPFTLQVDAIAADPTDTGILYAIAGGGVYRSSDGGSIWAGPDEGRVGVVQALALSGSNPPVVFAGTQTRGVYKSSAMLTLDRTEYCVGTTWTASLVNAMADTGIRLVGVSDGVQWAWPDWGTAGSDGKYSTAGTFAAGSEGNHQLYVEIGGIRSNTVSFSVSGCKPPAYQPRLEIEPPPGPNGFSLGASWNLSVGNAMADAEIRLAGITEGTPWEWPGWGRTDGNGNFSTGGTFADGTQGRYLLYVDIGGMKSNVVSLSVLDQPHLEINPSPAPDGFCPQGVSWILKLTNAPPNTAVSLVGDSAGVPPGFKLPGGAQTDSNGNFSASGPVTLPAGKYNMTVEVGGLRSNSVSVEVLPDCE
jgi:photosystem II stability/assembly factor-like uncharacterized protein